MVADLIGVTGATGAFGGRVARRLAARGAAQRLVVRDPERAPRLPGAGIACADYGNQGRMRDALGGVGTLMLVSAHETPDRIDLHRSAVDAAVAAGVSRIVYLSLLGAAGDATFTFARDHWATERYIAGTDLAYTVLRSSLYQDVLPFFVGDDGVLRGPAGDGRFAPVARDDVADVAVAVLLASAGVPGPGAGVPGAGAGAARAGGAGAHDGRTYDVTGPEALTMADVAAQLAEASGVPIRYQPETLDEAYASRTLNGALDWAVTGWVTSYAAIAAGEMDVVSDTVERIAGHPPVSFKAYLSADSDGPLRASMGPPA